MRDNFKPAGVLEWASFAHTEPSFIKQNGSNAFSSKDRIVLTKVQRDGIRYEKRTQDYLGELCKASPIFTCVCNPWLMFRRKGEHSSTVNYCQPDVLLISRTDKKVIVGEIKLSHTADSYRQLRQLYEPVLKHIFSGETEFALLEICKWFDPHTSFPETYYYAESVLQAEAGRLGVHIYRPRGRS